MKKQPTKTKRSAGDAQAQGDLQPGPFGEYRTQPLPATVAWEQLEQAYKEFRKAAHDDGSDAEMLAGIARVLRLLAVDGAFRDKAIKDAYRRHHQGSGRPPAPQRDQEQELCQRIEGAIRRFGDEPRMVAALILVDLPVFPALYTRAPKAQRMQYSVGGEFRPDDAFLEAVDVVAGAIGAPMVSDKGAESVVRAAMRALGADQAFVKHMFDPQSGDS